MGSARIKSVCFAKDILDILGTDVCLYRELHHAFRLCFDTAQASEGGDAPSGFTGSIRIRVDGFAKDILDILRTAVCL